MAELISLRAQIVSVFVVRRLNDRHTLTQAKAVALEADHLAWIVRDRPNGFEAEIQENLRPDAVVPEIGLEAELFVQHPQSAPRS